MGTIRRGVLPTDHFTTISNAWLRDASLSWSARGLLCWLVSHTADFEITEASIVAAGTAGRAAVRAAIQELESAGYLRRERLSVVTGGSTVDYVVADPGDENRTLRNVRKSDPRSDQGEQDVSAGEANGGKSNPRSSTEKNKEKNKTPSESSRATRLPEDFIPTEEMRAWFADEKLHFVLDARIEHEKFINYWVGCPGLKGRKLDWPRTWKNWMWSAAERAPRRPGNSLTPVSGAPRHYPSTTDGKVMQTLTLAEKFRQMEENQ